MKLHFQKGSIIHRDPELVDDVHSLVIMDRNGEPIMIVTHMDDDTIYSTKRTDENFGSALMALGLKMTSTAQVVKR